MAREWVKKIVAAAKPDPEYLARARAIAEAGGIQWDIVEKDPRVLGALRNLVEIVGSRKKKRETETVLYEPATKLLNAISLAIHDQAPASASPPPAPQETHVRSTDDQWTLDKGRAIAWFLRHLRSLRDDFMSVGLFPDYRSAVFSHEDLEILFETPDMLRVPYEANSPDDPLRIGWPVVASTGEGKTKANAEDGVVQMADYEFNNLRYRPDLYDSHGFRLRDGNLVLSSVNSCGFTMSEDVDFEELDYWIAHVVLVYHSDCTRNRRIRIDTEQEEFLCWMVDNLDDNREGPPLRTVLRRHATRPPHVCRYRHSFQAGRRQGRGPAEGEGGQYRAVLQTVIAGDRPGQVVRIAALRRHS